MSNMNDLLTMFSAMERVADSLLSAGQTNDAMVVLASEDIMRAHLEKYISASHLPSKQTEAIMSYLCNNT
jgi:hypothetical protein